MKSKANYWKFLPYSILSFFQWVSDILFDCVYCVFWISFVCFFPMCFASDVNIYWEVTLSPIDERGGQPWILIDMMDGGNWPKLSAVKNQSLIKVIRPNNCLHIRGLGRLTGGPNWPSLVEKRGGPTDLLWSKKRDMTQGRPQLTF